jgi:hypothetical protein
MRDLEQQIANWRRSMVKVSGHRPELLKELEEHLREEIDRLNRAGVATDKVFEMAAAKLGSPAPVAAEFDKLTATPTTWLPIKIARISVVVIALFLVAVFTFKLDKAGLLLATHVVCVTLGYLMTFIIGGLGICDLLSQWFGTSGPTQRHALRRSIFQFASISAILTGIAIVLGAFWAKDHMGRYWGWDLKETGGILVFGWTALIAAFQWLRPVQNSVVLLAILGNAVTAWAWFGAVTGGNPLSSPFLAVFMAVHVLLFAAGIARARTELRSNSASNC